MRAVWLLASHEFTARWRGWLALALLAGLGGAVVLATAAGARRTASAYPRFLHASRASDVLVSPENTGFGGYYGALARLPGVLAVAPLEGLQATPLGPAGLPGGQAVVDAPADARFGHLLEIPKLLAGRLPLPGRAGEMAVDQIGARILHLHVGSTLTLGAVTGPGALRPGGHVRHLTEQVTGIIVTRGSVFPVTELDKVPAILATPALARQLGPAYRAFDGAAVRLRPGVSAAAFSQAAQALARRFPATGRQVYVADENTQAGAIERAIRPQAVTLYLFALVFAVTALLIVGQAATRLLLATEADNPALASLGMTRTQLVAARLAEVTAAAAAGAIIAAGAAVAVSPLMPIGPARLAEPRPGVSADFVVLGPGAAALIVLLAARAAWPAWRGSTAGHRAASASAGHPAGVADWLASAGAGVTATTGVRFALEPGGGRTALPVRSALAGTALSVLTVAAAFTFGANLLHLVHTPRLYGKSWDLAVDLQFGTITSRQADRFLVAPGVSGWSFGNHGIIGIGRAVVPAVGMTPGRGSLVAPVLLDGHEPRSAHEIVLGTSVLRMIGRQVGQTVTVSADGRPQTMRIVGRAVFPDFGQGSFTPTDLGYGAETTASALTQRQTGGQPLPPWAAAPQYSVVLVTFAPGPRKAAQMAAFKRSMDSYCSQVAQSTCVVTSQRPNGITGYAGIDSTPEVLAGVLAVLGLAVLAQLIVVTGRRRRRDFAVLKALGLLRRQVSAITTWQVSTLAGLALIAGLPLGVAAGRWAWALFAGALGIPAGAVIPLPVIAVIVPAVLLAANAVAFWPGRAAARLRPAEVLRTE